MAEIKNSFLKSKMNKDLDDRLIPNGEYRDAQNISVGKSEDDDIGALENVLGNVLITDSQPLTFNNQIISNNGAGNGLSIVGNVPIEVGMNITGVDSNTGLPFTTIVTLVTYNAGANKTQLQTAYSEQHTLTGDKVNVFFPLESIGQYSDKPNNRIIIFLTSKDVNVEWPTNIDNYYNKITQAKNYIIAYTPGNAPEIQVIAKGVFLNFSINSPITGVNMIEDLLFFTDNNNQPRQVNVKTGIQSNGTYYTNEDHISVAKYAPYTPVELIRETTGVQIGAAGGSAAAGWQITIAANTAVTTGMSVVSRAATGDTPKIAGDSFIYVAAVATTGSNTVVVLSPFITDNTSFLEPIAGDKFRFLTSTMTNESKTSNWPGDPDFLEARFVRFSYRFKYADNEYSIMAPFSQIAFVPMQKGYFFNGDENNAYQSTIVDWMENFIQQVQLLITLPDAAESIAESYKISEIDILYKESDALAVKVVETIKVSNLNGSIISTDNTKAVFYGDGSFLPNNILVYTYQSQKPYKTLPQNQTTRVFDKVPIKALSQESVGNRIVYGNFLNQHTPPDSIDYNIGFVDKDSNLQSNWLEHPNHSVKQNRNYQVGFILADRYGRQSSVILSTVSQTSPSNYVGSTVYAPYEDNAFDVKGWFGKALQVIVNNTIKSSVDLDGEGAPGLYNGTIGSDYNPLGWYSYKVVVKQTEQDYYNVYLPGILDGYPLQISTSPITAVSAGVYNALATQIVLNTAPSGLSSGMVIQLSSGLEVGTINSVNGATINTTPLIYSVSSGVTLTFTNPNTYIPFPIGEDGKTAHIVLFNDNINKVPRDLAEVGPEQKQFRSSVQLFGRVTNTMTIGVAANKQFYGVAPEQARSSHTVVTIGESEDLNIIYDELADPGGKNNFYQIDTNPLIGRVSTPVPIGITSNNSVNTNMKPFLAVYETEPQESLLDLFWETATTGLISELNTAVEVDNTSPSFFGDTEYTQKENQIATGISGVLNATPVSGGATLLTLTAANTLIVSTMEIYYNGIRKSTVVSNDGGGVFTITSVIGTAIPAGATLEFQSTIAGDQYGRYVTGFFFPKTSSNVDVNDTTAGQLTSVTSNSGIDLLSPVEKFGLYGPGTQQLDGAANIGAYRLYIKQSEFNFLENSSIGSNGTSNARDRYTFTIAITENNSNVVSLSTLGQLTNIAPVATMNAMSVTFSGTAIGVVPGTNSSSWLNNTASGLKFEFDTNGGTLGSVPLGIDGQPGFVINALGSNAGTITKGSQNVNIGAYTVGIKISDAIASNLSPGNGSLNSFINQEITVGASQVNSTALTTLCISDFVVPRSDSNTLTDKGCVANGDISSGNTYTGVWYIADSILTTSNLPVTPVMETSSGTSIPNAYRLGTAAHSAGTIAFLLNSRIFKNSNINNSPRAQLTWRIWRRPVGGSLSDWDQGFSDVNNLNGSSGVPVSFNSTYGAQQGKTMYNQVVKAYARGNGADDFEYCIAATSMGNTFADGSTTEKLAAWVQSTDLNFPGCVIENGSTIVNSYSFNTYYNYRYTGSQTQYTCGTSPQGNLYSSIPYAEYVNQLFTTEARNVAWSPVNYDSATPYYRWNVHSAGVVGGSSLTTPFSTLVASGKFNSALGSVYRTNSESPNVYVCWTNSSPLATAVQRIGNNN